MNAAIIKYQQTTVNRQRRVPLKVYKYLHIYHTSKEGPVNTSEQCAVSIETDNGK